jgi:hypothetical protein
MQSLAFLWFELQMTQQYLREITFGPAQSLANSTDSNTPSGAGTVRRTSVKQVPRTTSANRDRVRCSPGQDLLG